MLLKAGVQNYDGSAKVQNGKAVGVPGRFIEENDKWCRDGAHYDVDPSVHQTNEEEAHIEAYL